MMKVTETCLPGVLIIEPAVHGDSRGFFVESFHAERYLQDAGINLTFVQDNQSRSSKNVLRGIHAQQSQPQGKLARVSYGRVFDVAVDINPASAQFGEWVGVELSDVNQRQIWIPPGYGHGFVVLSELADFQYKCTNYYAPNDEVGVIWNDADVGIEWPVDTPQVSAKDQKLPTLAELRQSQVS